MKKIAIRPRPPVGCGAMAGVSVGSITLILNICLNICCNMTTKTITIKEDIYKMLLSIKGTNESFSNFFERLVKSRSNIDKLRELRGSVEFRNKEALLRELSKKREEIRY